MIAPMTFYRSQETGFLFGIPQITFESRRRNPVSGLGFWQPYTNPVKSCSGEKAPD
jgi:hypothetical protein